jgi:hypothetical protein
MNVAKRTRAGFAVLAALGLACAPAAQAQQYAVTDLGTLGGTSSQRAYRGRGRQRSARGERSGT